jgi:hypothetical protein
MRAELLAQVPRLLVQGSSAWRGLMEATRAAATLLAKQGKLKVGYTSSYPVCTHWSTARPAQILQKGKVLDPNQVIKGPIRLSL